MTATVLVEYLVAGDRTVVFGLRPEFEEPRFAELDTPRDELREWVIERFDVTRGSDVLDLDASQLSDEIGYLIGPLVDWTDHGDTVWLVPHDVLHHVPLHAGTIEGDALVARNAVCYTPSAAVMRHCQSRQTGRRQHALVMGDSLGDLLHAREEARAVAGRFGSAPLQGRAASKRALMEGLLESQHPIDVLHFSCHGYFRADDPLGSGIVLAPEGEPSAAPKSESHWNLTAEEIFDLDLTADLVTVSACESGISDVHPGDELIGLTRALIYAGTASLLVTLWPVDDLSTTLLMEGFYDRLLDGRAGKADALAQAQSALRSMTAAEVVSFCEERLAELPPEEAEASALLQLDRAGALAAAGDLLPAIEACEIVRRQLAQDGGKRADQIAAEVEERLLFLQLRAEVETELDYGIRPFEHPYHWAGLVLVGDWR
jgi:CHAT domain-containing protein